MCCVVVCCVVLGVGVGVVVGVGAVVGFGLSGSPLRRTPNARDHPRLTAQNFALFIPLPPHFRSFCLSGCLLVEFWWCFRRLGLHTIARELQTCTLEGPGASPPKFHEKTPKRGKKERKWRREAEKKREILGSPTLRDPNLQATLRGRIFSGFWAPPHKI